MAGLVEGKSGLVTGSAGGIGAGRPRSPWRARAPTSSVTDLPARAQDGEETVTGLITDRRAGTARFVPGDVTVDADAKAGRSTRRSRRSAGWTSRTTTPASSCRPRHRHDEPEWDAVITSTSRASGSACATRSTGWWPRAARRDREHRLARRPHGRPVARRVHAKQARRRRAHEGGGDRVRRGRDPRERVCPARDRHRDDHVAAARAPARARWRRRRSSGSGSPRRWARS